MLYIRDEMYTTQAEEVQLLSQNAQSREASLRGPIWLDLLGKLKASLTHLNTLVSHCTEKQISVYWRKGDSIYEG